MPAHELDTLQTSTLHLQIGHFQHLKNSRIEFENREARCKCNRAAYAYVRVFTFAFEQLTNNFQIYDTVSVLYAVAAPRAARLPYHYPWLQLVLHPIHPRDCGSSLTKFERQTARCARRAWVVKPYIPNKLFSLIKLRVYYDPTRPVEIWGAKRARACVWTTVRVLIEGAHRASDPPKGHAMPFYLRRP